MNAHAGEFRKHKVQSEGVRSTVIPNNDKPQVWLTNNRPEATVQRKLQNAANNSPKTSHVSSFEKMINEHSQTASLPSNTSKGTIQRLVPVELLVDDATKKKIRAEGAVQDFKGGSSAGKYGWLGVTSYRSSYEITDGTYTNSETTPAYQNKFTKAEAGHVLAKRNGGDGTDAWNIFAQCGGVNNSLYKSFEGRMRAALALYDDNDTVKFTSYLQGAEIEEGGLISDEVLSDASSISSEDST